MKDNSITNKEQIYFLCLKFATAHLPRSSGHLNWFPEQAVSHLKESRLLFFDPGILILSDFMRAILIPTPSTVVRSKIAESNLFFVMRKITSWLIQCSNLMALINRDIRPGAYYRFSSSLCSPTSKLLHKDRSEGKL